MYYEITLQVKVNIVAENKKEAIIGAMTSVGNVDVEDVVSIEEHW